jgi:hypothetical protein
MRKTGVNWSIYLGRCFGAYLIIILIVVTIQ